MVYVLVRRLVMAGSITPDTLRPETMTVDKPERLDQQIFLEELLRSPADQGAINPVQPETQRSNANLGERNGLPILIDNGDGIVTPSDLGAVYGASRFTAGNKLAEQPEQVVMIGERHSFGPEARIIDVAVRNAVQDGKAAYAGLEIPAEPEYVELVNQLNAGDISREAFSEKFQNAVDEKHGPDSLESLFFTNDILRINERGGQVFLLDAPSSWQGNRDAYMEQATLEAVRRADSESAETDVPNKIFLQVGNIHSQQQEGIPTPPPSIDINADFANPLGERLENRLGDDKVLSVATEAIDEVGISGFSPPFESWEAVVPLVPASYDTIR